MNNIFRFLCGFVPGFFRQVTPPFLELYIPRSAGSFGVMILKSQARQ
jgi:hypothetical protein